MPGIQPDGPPLFWKFLPVMPTFLPICTMSFAIWLQTGSWLAVGMTNSFLPLTFAVLKAGPGGTNAGIWLALLTSDSKVFTWPEDSPSLPPPWPADDEQAAPAKASPAATAVIITRRARALAGRPGWNLFIGVPSSRDAM